MTTTTKNPGLSARMGSVEAALAAHQTAASPTAAPEPVESTIPIATSVRLSPAIHDALRRIAFEQRVSIHSLILEGVEMAIAKKRK